MKKIFWIVVFALSVNHAEAQEIVSKEILVQNVQNIKRFANKDVAFVSSQVQLTKQQQQVLFELATIKYKIVAEQTPKNAEKALKVLKERFDIVLEAENFTQFKNNPKNVKFLSGEVYYSATN